jgi:hypothetical protein
MTSSIKTTGVLYNTKEYNKFTSAPNNRIINKAQVNRLVKAIQKKNLLHANPIIVNEDMEVIDGQHRLRAASILEIPIYYLVTDASEDDIVMLNTNQRNWQTTDYIRYYANEGVYDYILLQQQLDSTSHKVSEILELLDKSTTRSQISKGNYKIVSSDEAKRRLDMLAHVKDMFGRSLYQVQVKALRVAMAHHAFDDEHFKNNVSIQRRKLYAAANHRDQLNNYEEIYNYRLTEKNRIRFY